MKTTWGRVKRVLCEEFNRESYKRQLDEIIERHAAPHTYVRFDDRERFSVARSFRTDMNVNDHSNHAGLWTYMIEPGAHELSEYTFGNGGRWVTILKARNPKRLVRSDKYTITDLESDIKILARRVGEERIRTTLAAHEKWKQERLNDFKNSTEFDQSEEFVQDAIKDLEAETTPFEMLDSLARPFGQSSDHRDRQRQFYLELGYLGIEDPLGVIDTHGWTAVHFDPRNVVIVKRYHLKDAFDPEEYDRKEAEYWSKRKTPEDFDGSRPENDPGDPSHEPGFYYNVDGERKVDPREPDE